MFYKNTSVYTATINSAVYAYEVRRTLFKKTFSVFPYSYRNTSGSLGEREIEVGTRARGASVSTQFRVLPNFHECFYNVWEHVKKCFLFLLILIL